MSNISKVARYFNYKYYINIGISPTVCNVKMECTNITSYYPPQNNHIWLYELTTPKRLRITP